MTYREQAEAAQDHDINDNDCRKHHEPLYSGWCKACAATAIERAVTEAIPRATTQPFTPDWDLLEGANKSLREHMALAKAARESEQRFREQVAAALKELRAELVADANAMATHGSGTSSCTIEDAFDATIAALLGGTEEAK